MMNTTPKEDTTMFSVTLTITDPETGEIFTDTASGNTARTAGAASASLARSYERDGCKVAISRIEKPAR